MLEAISALSQVTLFGFLYLVILAAIASQFHTTPWLQIESGTCAIDYQEASKMEFLTVSDSIRIDSPAAVFSYVSPRITNGLVEYLVLLLLDKSSYLVGEIVCTDEVIGSVRLPHVERVAVLCRENQAESVIIAHNHPLGTMYPSPEDVHYTNSLMDRLEERGITLTDHLIVTTSGYHSIKEYCRNPAFILR